MNNKTQNPTPNTGSDPGQSSGQYEDGADARDLAPAYAFGATDLADDEAVRSAMARNTETGEEVQAYRRLFTTMHYTAAPVAPPPELEAKLRAALQPPLAPIAQPYTGPGSQAAIAPADQPMYGAPAPKAPSATPAESERLGYWPSTAAPISSTKSKATTNPFATSNRVNPLTGRPISAAPTTPTGYTPPPAYSQQSAYAPPPIYAGTPKAATRPTVPYIPPTMPQRAPAQPIPSDFVALPIGQTQARTRNGGGAWVGWGAALLAVALLVGSNFVWYGREQQQGIASQQTGAQVAQLQKELATTQEALATLQATADQSASEAVESTTTLAERESEINSLRAQLTDALNALYESEATLAATTAEGDGTGIMISQSTLGALAQGALDDATLAPLDAASPMTASARIMWNPEMQSGIMMAMDMPELPEDEIYQLWFLRGGVPVSAGVFNIDNTGMGMLEMNDMPIGDYEVAAITAEPSGGSPAPTGTILIAGEL